jgi:hypothetical protein
MFLLFSATYSFTANSQVVSNSINTNKILFTKYLPQSMSAPDGPYRKEIWISSYEGAVQDKINIILPNGLFLATDCNPRLSPNGATLFFEAGTPTQFGIIPAKAIYSCKLDGSSLTKLYDITKEPVTNTKDKTLPGSTVIIKINSVY